MLDYNLISSRRKVIIEKSIDFSKKGLYGLKFCSYNNLNNQESLLIVKLSPKVCSSISTGESGNYVERFDPFKLEIIDSIDNNGSINFYNWLYDSINKNTSKGVDMYFFELTPYIPILSLRGCCFNDFSFSSNTNTLSVNFFSYLFSE